MVLEHKTLDLFDRMLFEKAIVKPPFKRPYPMPDEACFLYVLKGRLTTVSSIVQIEAGEKEALLMKCGSYFFKMFPADSNVTYEAVAVHFYPDVLKKVFQHDIPSFFKKGGRNVSGNEMVKLKVDILLEKYFDSILFYFANPELVSEELLILKIKELFLLLDQSSSASGIREIISNLFTPRVYSFKEIIEAHLYTNLTLVELAELTNLSVSSFKREFKNIYNESPGRYFRNQKLRKAEELLSLSDMNITEIAFECGFNDLANFSTAFKEKYGCSPSRYKSPS